MQQTLCPESIRFCGANCNETETKNQLRWRLKYLSKGKPYNTRTMDTEANRFYDRNHQMYDAALLTRCYTQHALRPFIDSESNHIRSFIKIPFINIGIDFIDLPSKIPG